MTAPIPELPPSISPPRWLQRLPRWGRALLIVAFYLAAWYVLDRIAVQFETAPEVQIWYPPSALDIVLLLVFGLRFAFALVLNTFVHEWFVTERHLPLSTWIVFNVVTTGGYASACWLLLRVFRINPRLRQLRDVIWFTLVAGLAAPFLVALLQIINFAANGLFSWASAPTLVLHYWSGDATGIGMLAPFLLVLFRKLPWLWTTREPRSQQHVIGANDELRLPSQRGIPTLLFHIALLALGVWVAYAAPRGRNLDYTYMVFLPLVWIAVKYGLPRASATVLGLNVGVALLFGFRLKTSDPLALQFGLMGFTFMGILLGAIATDQQRGEATLRNLYQEVQALNQGLERQVQERTAQLQAQMLQLQQLSELKDDFLNTVSHELRSPLANIKMAAQMLQVAANPESRDRYLQILQTECNRETNLINDLLDLQRLEAGADTVEVAPLSLHEWLPPIVDTFRARTRARQQTLRLTLPTYLPVLVSDAAKLERIITELITNACKYTPVDGEINVSVDARTIAPNQTAGIGLTVSNSGSEIPAAELPRIFEKFYRISRGDRSNQGGTGLGLALVQKLVQQLGGTVSVESEAMQTVFTVELPQVQQRRDELG